MRIKDTKISYKLARLILDLTGISSNFLEISKRIEMQIAESSSENYYDEEDSRNHQHGWSYHEIKLIDLFKPQDCIEGVLSESQVEKLIAVSNKGHLKVEIGRLNGLRAKHEWSIKLKIPQSPHMLGIEKFTMHIQLEFHLKNRLEPQIEYVKTDTDDENLSKIYTAYSLKYE